MSQNCFSATATIAVASNFKPVVEKLQAIFEWQSSHRLLVVSSSTVVLYNQILNGAPFDLFLSADSTHPQLLEDKEIAVRGSSMTYALGQLSLVHREETIQTIDDLPKLLSQSQTTLAIANSKTAPYGKAAREVLDYLNIGQDQLRIVSAPNIALCYQMWHSGNTDLAFVSTSLIQDQNTITVPQAMYSKIKQQAVLLKRAANNDAAHEFFNFLKSKGAQQLILKHGYQLASTL